MKSAFFQEQKRYTLSDLICVLGCSTKEINILIKKLKTHGILKTVKKDKAQKDKTDLLDTDITYEDTGTNNDKYYYVFTFVGVVIITQNIDHHTEQYVLKCFPKYLNTEKPKAELQQVIKVIEKYVNKSEKKNKPQNILLFDEYDDSTSYNILSVMIFLLQDYYENGIYQNTEEIIEVNGNGEILWDKTINETSIFLSDGRPYYLDLLTRKQMADNYDYFKRIHECILTEISKRLKEMDLLDLFAIPEVELSDCDLSDFGNVEYILYRIEKEINIQFISRKQSVLKAMYAYVKNEGNSGYTDGLSLWGTTTFYEIWEDVCSNILDNQLKKKLRTLHLPNQIDEKKYDLDSSLFNIIEKPMWTFTKNPASKSLEPDAVTISNIDENWQFVIFDAKYYTPTLNEGAPPENQPGIESITKQYLYQLAYKEFINDQGFSEKMIKNCFLFPTEKNDGIEHRGEVSLKMLENLQLQNIQIRFVPAKMAYTLYLSGKKLNVSELRLDSDS